MNGEEKVAGEAAPDELKTGTGRLLIVDDDPAAASMLRRMLKGHGHDVREAASGQICLDVMDEFAPEVILLDIDMPGIDGYETCQRIRSRYDRANLTILFLSGRDSLDDRLRAYDAGGDDFVAKPFKAEEIRRKIALAVAARTRRRQLFAEKVSAEETSNVLMQGYDEMGAVLKFSRGALGCRSLAALAELVISSMRGTQAESLVQLRGSAAAGTLTLSSKGPASPLEESVIEGMRSHDRIFQFRSRMIVNYDSVSVLVVNMPLADDALAGRIRDYAAMVTETAEDAVANISLRADAVLRAKALRCLAAEGHAGIEKLLASHSAQRMETRCVLEKMVEKIEAMYYQFGLSDRQEAAISHMLRSGKDEVLTLFEHFGSDFNVQLTTILDGLNQASTHRIDTEDSAAATNEVWN